MPRSVEARARRTAKIYAITVVLLTVVPLLVRTEAALSLLLGIALLSWPWAGLVLRAIPGLPPDSWFQLVGFAIGAAVNGVLLYVLVGGRFRSED
jgi:hypothetical protein